MRWSQISALLVALLSNNEAEAQAKLPTIGFMGQSKASAEALRANAFVQRLRELERPRAGGPAADLPQAVAGPRERSSAQRADVRFEIGKLFVRGRQHLGRGPLLRPCVLAGESDKVGDRLALVFGADHRLAGANARRQQPQIVVEIARDDAHLALGSEEDEGLIEDRLAIAHQPERRISAAAVLTEDPVLGVSSWLPVQSRP